MTRKKETDTTSASKQPVFVHQRFEDDCGIAALSMLLGIEYIALYKLLEADKPTWDGCSDDHAIYAGVLFGRTVIVQELSPSKVGSTQKKFKGRPAVLVCPAKDGSTDVHAVYWSGKELFDPAPIGTRRYGKDGKTAFKTARDVWFLKD